MYLTVIHWLVAAMLSWVLPHAPALHEAQRARYTEIAQDAMAVAFDKSEAPLFVGPLGREKTATLMLAIASFESGFDKGVDAGTVQGDSGKSWCLMQVQLSTRDKDGKTSTRMNFKDDVYEYVYDKTKGYGGEDLSDRKLCFRMALHIMRASYKRCGDLSGYTAGVCLKDEPKAMNRLGRARRLGVATWFGADITDSDVVTTLLTP